MLTHEKPQSAIMAVMKKYARPRPPTDNPPHYLREWRKYKGLTQEVVAERAEMDKGSISRLERYETNYTQETLEAFAFALGVAPVDLLSAPPDPAMPENDITRHLKLLKTKEERATAARILKALTEDKKAAG